GPRCPGRCPWAQACPGPGAAASPGPRPAAGHCPERCRRTPCSTAPGSCVASAGHASSATGPFAGEALRPGPTVRPVHATCQGSLSCGKGPATRPVLTKDEEPLRKDWTMRFFSRLCVGDTVSLPSFPGRLSIKIERRRPNRRRPWKPRGGKRKPVITPVITDHRKLLSSRRRERPVGLRSAVAVKLPGVADFADHVQVEIGDDDVVGVARACGEDAAARIAEVTLAVELADAPGFFPAGSVDGADEVAVGDGVGRLFEFPQVFGQAGDGGAGIEDDLGACQAEAAGALGKVSVIADVDADLGEARAEHGIAEVAGAKIVLFPKAGQHLWNVDLAKLAQVGAVGIDHRRRVIV